MSNLNDFKLYIRPYGGCLSDSKFIKCLLMSKNLKSFTTNFFKKVFAKCKYLFQIVTCLTVNKAICAS